MTILIPIKIKWILLIFIQIPLAIFSFKYAWRQSRVVAFQFWLNELAMRWSLKHVQEISDGKEISACEWFYGKKPQRYWRMVFSRKPLTLEAWFSPEVVKKIKS